MTIVDSLRQSISLTERLCSVINQSYSNRLLIKFKYYRIGSPYPRLFTFNPSASSTIGDTVNKMKFKLDIFSKNDILKNEISVKEHDGGIISNDISTLRAFQTGNFLSINQRSYKIIENLPEIASFSLPYVLHCNFYIYPIIELLNCTEYHVQWFVSRLPRKDSLGLNASTITNKLFESLENDHKGVKLPEIFVGHELRVVVFPQNDSQIGFEVVCGGILRESLTLPIRNLKTNSFNNEDSKLFRVVSYNVLAGSCTVDSYAKNELYKYCSPELLCPKYRKVLLNEEIIGYSPDVVCLQEDDLDIGLDSLNSIYPRRMYRRTSEKNLTTIFRQDKFTLIAEFFIDLAAICFKSPHYSQIRSMLDSSSPEISDLFFSRKNYLQCTVLGFHGSTGVRPTTLCIGNTHLYSHPHADAIRLLQVTLCLSEMTMILNELCSKGYQPIPMLCGDFNSLPTSAVYRFATGDRISFDDATWNVSGVGGFKNIRVGKMAGMDLSHYLSLSSAFGTPKYTHFIERFSGCLDYIFYDQKKLNVRSFLEFPDEKVITEQVALPNERIGSDHLALVVDFSVK